MSCRHAHTKHTRDHAFHIMFIFKAIQNNTHVIITEGNTSVPNPGTTLRVGCRSTQETTQSALAGRPVETNSLQQSTSVSQHSTCGRGWELIHTHTPHGAQVPFPGILHSPCTNHKQHAESIECLAMGIGPPPRKHTNTQYNGCDVRPTSCICMSQCRGYSSDILLSHNDHSIVQTIHELNLHTQQPRILVLSRQKAMTSHRLHHTNLPWTGRRYISAGLPQKNTVTRRHVTIITMFSRHRSCCRHKDSRNGTAPSLIL